MTDRRMLIDCAKAICPWCGGRIFHDDEAPLAFGSPGSGNYVHHHGTQRVLCKASAIWVYARFLFGVEFLSRSPRGWVKTEGGGV